jgi:catechol 2,3-dioxygenase-like lactoylglutathione lyase family enzyme
MIKKLNHVTIWVKDQEEALKFYRDKLGFKAVTDDSSSIPNYRWLTVAPPLQTEIVIVLAIPQDPKDEKQIGQQGTWVLESDNIQADYDLLKSRGVKIHNEPQHNKWRSDFVFEDLYGNTYDVVQPSQP